MPGEQEVSAIARLSLDPKPQQGGLLPTLDPVAPMGAADARSQDRAIDRCGIAPSNCSQQVDARHLLLGTKKDLRS